jgi:hypothetical protein
MPDTPSGGAGDFSSRSQGRRKRAPSLPQLGRVDPVLLSLWASHHDGMFQGGLQPYQRLNAPFEPVSGPFLVLQMTMLQARVSGRKSPIP